MVWMKEAIVLITGMPGSGKSEFISVAKEAGIQVVCMGDVVRHYARKKKIPPEKIGEFADSERRRYGYDIWAKRTIPLLQVRRAIIEGVRGMDEVERFKKEFGKNLKIVAIHSSPSHRFERMKRRKRDDDSDRREEFTRRDQRELGWGIAEVIALADYLLVNDDTLEKFKKEARDLLIRLFEN